MWCAYNNRILFRQKKHKIVISNLDKPKVFTPGKISQRQKDKHCIIPSYVESKKSELTESENGVMAIIT